MTSCCAERIRAATLLAIVTSSSGTVLARDLGGPVREHRGRHPGELQAACASSSRASQSAASAAHSARLGAGGRRLRSATGAASDAIG